MTPMDEAELRRELTAVDVAPRDDSALADTVIRRGTGIRRRRRVVGALAVVLIAGGIGIGAALLPGRDAVPADPTQTPTVSVTTPAAWTDLTRLPGRYGTVDALRLPLDGATTAPDVTVAEAPYPLQCDRQGLSLTTLGALRAGRTMQLGAPTTGEVESVLLFRDADAAGAFMQELRTALEGCQAGVDREPVADGDRLHRVVPVLETPEGPGEERLAAGVFVQFSLDGGVTWVESTEASVEYWVRAGDRVALVALSGEHVGDLTQDPAVMGDLDGRITQILGQ